MAGSGSAAVRAEDSGSALGQLNASRHAARAWVELGNLLDEAGDSAGAVRAFRQATVSMNLAGPPAVRSESRSRELATDDRPDR